MTHYYDPQQMADHARSELKCKFTDVELKAIQYQQAVINELRYGYFLADMSQINKNQIPFNVTRIRNNIGRYGKPQKYWWDWFHKNYPMIKIIKKGNSIQGVISMVETDIPLEILRAGGNNAEYVRSIYSQFDEECEVHPVKINLRNLNNYILATTAQNSPNKTIQNNLKTAHQLYSIAQAFDGVIPQIVNHSSFGRTYYRGPNLQSVHTTVREAALGPCYNVDIDSSVFNWKYSCVAFQKELTYTEELIREKLRVRKTLALQVFGDSNKWAVDLIKKTLTAISFGAKGANSSGWYKNTAGSWTQGAISEIIKSKEKREALFADPWMVKFMDEQNRINDFIYSELVEMINQGQISENKLEDVRSQSGRIHRNKLISWAYQQSEQVLMKTLLNSEYASEVLLQVHDGVYFKTKPNMPSLQTLLQENWPLATLSITEVDGYQYKNVEDIAQHREFIKAQEREANNGFDPVVTGIHTERLAVKQYDAHSEPDWDDYQAKQMNEYYEHFPEDRPADPNMPAFARKALGK